MSDLSVVATSNRTSKQIDTALELQRLDTLLESDERANGGHDAEPTARCAAKTEMDELLK